MYAVYDGDGNITQYIDFTCFGFSLPNGSPYGFIECRLDDDKRRVVHSDYWFDGNGVIERSVFDVYPEYDVETNSNITLAVPVGTTIEYDGDSTISDGSVTIDTGAYDDVHVLTLSKPGYKTLSVTIRVGSAS